MALLLDVVIDLMPLFGDSMGFHRSIRDISAIELASFRIDSSSLIVLLVNFNISRVM